MSTQCGEPCILDVVQSLLSPRCHAQHKAQKQVCCLGSEDITTIALPHTTLEKH